MSLLLSLLLLSTTTTIITADPIYGEYEISMPRFRYVEWDDLDDDYQDLAREVGYNEESWDNFYTNEIESLSFGALETKEYLESPRRVDADNPRSVLAQMGFTENVWDCWINHYGDYSWDELEDYKINEDYEELGWSERRWDNGNAPESSEKGWSELSRRDKQAAANLCYIPETWDGEEMDDVEDDSEYLEDNDEPWIERYREDDLIYSEWTVTMPRNRFIMWDDLSSKSRRLARSIGYTSASWERPYSHEIEFFAFEDLEDDDYLEGEDIIDRPNSVLGDFGFDEESWDCWVNHYGGYNWDDLVEYKVVEAYETLGWDEKSWEGKSKGRPNTSQKYWEDLSDDEKQAAANLCYLPETWDEQEFDKFITKSEYLASTEPWNELSNVGGGFCFPGSVTVIVQDVGLTPMSQLKLGDSVLVDTKGTYEQVYTFGHYEPKTVLKPSSLFTKITTTNGAELILSPNHMVASVGRTIPAKQVQNGDLLLHATEGEVVVKFVKPVEEPHTGLYAPFTPSGYLVVNNIVASNYVSLQGTETLEFSAKQKTILSHQWIAHSANAPHRLYCNLSSKCKKETYTANGISRWVATPMAISEYILNSNNIIISTMGLIIIIAITTGFAVLGFLFATPIMTANSFIFVALMFLSRYHFQHTKQKIA